MGFLETFENTEIEQQEEVIEDIYTTEFIGNDDDLNDNDLNDYDLDNKITINKNDIMLFSGNTEQTETIETTESSVYEFIDYTEQLNNIVVSLDVIQLLGTIAVCYIVSNLVFGFMKIRKEGDI